MSDIVATADIPPASTDYIEPPPADVSRETYGYNDRLLDARLSGYDWPEIDNYLSERSGAAFAEGYDQRDVNDYLGVAAPEALQYRLDTDWRSRLSWDEPFAQRLRGSASDIPLTPLEGPSGVRIATVANLDLPVDTAMPGADFIEPPPSGLALDDEFTRGSYARALLDDAVRSPRDFAERYMAGVSRETSDLPTVVRAARELVSSLPSDREFIDQAVAIAGATGVEVTGDTVRTIRRNLIDHWADTGEPLPLVHKRAFEDPDFAAGIVTEKKPDVEAAANQSGFFDGFLLGFETPGEELQAKIDAGEINSLSGALGLAAGRIPRAMYEQARDIGIKAGKALMGEGTLTADEALFASMFGLRGPLVRDTLGGYKPMARVIDPDAPPGAGPAGGVAEVPGSPALFEPPKPAERLPVEPPAAGVSRETPSPLDFVPEATPAEKMQALARDWRENRGEIAADLRARNGGVLPDEADPAFFQKLAAGQDAQTQALAAGHDAARATVQIFNAMLGDETGALNILSTPAQRARRQARGGGRDYAQEMLIRMQGQTNQVMSHFSHKFDNWETAAGTVENVWRAVNKHMPEFEAEIRKGPMGDPMGKMVGNLIDYVEGRSAGVALRHDSPLAPAADAMRYVYQHQEQLMREAYARGEITLNSYFVDYFRHFWKNPNKAQQAFDMYVGATGKLGSSAGMQKRSLPTYGDGVRMGLEPAITNPLELTLFDAGQKMRYLNAVKELKKAEADGAVVWRSKPLENEVVLKGGMNMRSIGDNMIQFRVANEGFARMWNRWIDRSMYDLPRTSTLPEKIRFTINTLKTLSLISPTYHAGTIAMESIAGAVGRVVTDLANGHPVRAAWNTFKVPIAPVETFIQGKIGQRAYNNLVQDEAIRLAVEAGARFGPRQRVYRSGAATPISEVLRRGAVMQELRADLRHIIGDPKDPAMYRLFHVLPNSAGVVFHEIGRVMNAVGAPLFDASIPPMKVGIHLQRIRQFLENHPTATDAEKSAYARQVVRNTDERLGEMNFDNVFWANWVKETFQTVMVSLPWVYGSVRFFSSAAQINIERGFKPEFNPVAISTMIGFIVAYTMENAIYQYLKTGTTPLDTDTPLRDLFGGGRTGGVTTRGVPERALLPSQFKEVMDYYKIGAYIAYDPRKAPEAFGHYLAGKGNSFMQWTRGILTGHDAIGHDIKYMPGGYTEFTRKTLLPIFMSTYEQRKKGTNISPVETFLGIRPVTKAIEDPEGFWFDMERFDQRRAQDALRRARRENQIYEQQRPLPESPTRGRNTTPRSGGGFTGGGPGGTTYAPSSRRRGPNGSGFTGGGPGGTTYAPSSRRRGPNGSGYTGGGPSR